MIVTVAPAMVIVPARSNAPVLAATSAVTVPLPVPDGPAEIAIHDAFDDAVHEQPVVVATAKLTEPPVDCTIVLVGVTVYVQLVAAW